MTNDKRLTEAVNCVVKELAALREEISGLRDDILGLKALPVDALSPEEKERRKQESWLQDAAARSSQKAFTKGEQ